MTRSIHNDWRLMALTDGNYEDYLLLGADNDRYRAITRHNLDHVRLLDDRIEYYDLNYMKRDARDWEAARLALSAFILAHS